MTDYTDNYEMLCRILLMDAGAAIYDSATVAEAYRQAMHEYTNALPYEVNEVMVLPGDGREIALNTIGTAYGEIIDVTQVYWPYDTLVTIWPPNRVRGFTLYWDDLNPVLFLNRIDGDEPQLGDELRIWYTTRHCIEGMDGHTFTTIPYKHRELLVSGAAGFAAMSRTLDLTETTSADQYATGLLGTWAQRKLKEFRAELEKQKAVHTRAGLPFGDGWKLDKWDL